MPTTQIKKYKKHLEDRYLKLLEISDNYRYEDESMSDIAAFKAMKLEKKISQVRFLDR